VLLYAATNFAKFELSFFAPNACFATQRAGAGEAEAAASAKPSCFPRFDSLTAFVSYINGNSKSAAGSSHAGIGAMVVAAAAAGLAIVI
jgi:hypothetical protein